MRFEVFWRMWTIFLAAMTCDKPISIIIRVCTSPPQARKNLVFTVGIEPIEGYFAEEIAYNWNIFQTTNLIQNKFLARGKRNIKFRKLVSPLLGIYF